MSQFLLILRDDPSDFADYSPDQFQALIVEYAAWSRRLAAEDRVKGGQKLADGGAVLTKRSGDVVVTDGPYGEAKEVVGGYYLIEAKDLAHAVDLCRDHPQLANGSVEIRPIDLME